jgi:RND family efflux transporter MFP subunit
MAAVIRTADIKAMTASFSAAPGLAFPVHVREIAQRADPTTQTFNVRVAMKKPQGINLLPGMTATVSMTYQRAEILGPRIFVPVAAVSRDSAGETAVWIVSPEQTVTRHPVRTGGLTGGRIEILEGLQPGDRIAAAGANHLREGMQVRELGDALGAARP